MIDERYTEAGDPRLESAVAERIEQMVGRARTIPGLDALLLGGSLGRGEGTFTRGPDGDRLSSDVELYLVGRASSLRDDARRLESELAEGYGLDVSAAWLEPKMLRGCRAKNLSWRPARTIRLYEIAAGSRVLVGVPPDVCRIDPTRLPLGEGVRLVLNRLAEANPLIADGSDDGRRWGDKILTALGDTILLARGEYTVRYRDRATRLREIEPSWPMPSGWRSAILGAYERKLTGAGGSVPAPSDGLELLLATMRPTVWAVAAIGVDPLATFPQRFAIAGARRPELLRYLPPFGPRATYEALVLLARARRSGLELSGRAVRQAVLGRPLSLALQGAALPLHVGIVAGDAALVDAASEALRWAGLPPRALVGSRNPGRLAHLLRRHWAESS
jgi:hypothetical protein